MDYSGDPSINNASKYFIGLYDNGAGNSFDEVAIHPYASNEINYIGLDDTINVLESLNMSNKKIWINEYGWNIDDDDTKTKYLINSLNNVKYNYSDKVIQMSYLQIQDLQNSNWGIVDVDYTTKIISPRNSWYAFNEFDKT